MATRQKKTRTKPIKNTKPIHVRHPGFKGDVPFLAALWVITTCIFLPALGNDFTNWDDVMYVTDNPLLTDLSWDGIRKIFSTPVVSNYHPLTILSLAFNYHLTALEPWSYHLTSILIHGCNTLLVYWLIMLLSQKNRWVSFMTALVFGIHPMHVESVAWISERKDQLYAFFYLLSLISYVFYTGKRQAKYLIMATCLGFLSLLSKPAAIVLPFTMLLIDYYAGRKWKFSLVTEKLPLFLMAIAFAYITFNIQSERAIASVDMHSLPERIGFAGYGVVWYLIKFIFPYPLSALHPFPGELPWTYPGSVILTLAGVILLVWKVRNKLIHFGFGFYLINLILVLQLVSIGNAVVAERYTYVPYIGIGFMVTGLLFQIIREKNKGLKPVIISIAVIFLAGFGLLTFMRIPVWKSSHALWTDVLRHYPDSPRAWTNKGLMHYDMKEWDRTLQDLSAALAHDPHYANALEWRAKTYLETKQGALALADARLFQSLYPSSNEALFILARSYDAAGMPEDAVETYTKLIKKAPDIPDYINNRGVIYFNKLKRYEEARKDFETCISLKPDQGLYYLNLSRCFYMLNDHANARTQAIKAKNLGEKIDPSYAAVIGLQ